MWRIFQYGDYKFKFGLDFENQPKKEEPKLHHFRHSKGLNYFTLANQTCKLELELKFVCGWPFKVGIVAPSSMAM